MKKEIITVDKLLSVWVVIYSIGYILNIFPYNPIILLYLSIMFFIIGTIIIINNYNENTRLLYFIANNVIIKVPLILLIWRKNIKTIDIAFTLIFITTYMIYMIFINEDIISIYKDLLINIIDCTKGRQTSLNILFRSIINKFIT